MSQEIRRKKISAAEEKHRENKLNRREFLTTATLAGSALALVAAATNNIRAQKTDDKQKTMTKTAPKTEIDFLAEYPTTLLESAIALIRGSHAEMQLTRPPGLARRTAGNQRIVGYAVTSTFSVDFEDARPRRENADYWTHVFEQPGPKIAVAFDASQKPLAGSSWGQLNAHIHTALGCRGVVTNGGVRDLGEFEKLGFTVFSGGLVVEHGSPHFLNFGEPVTLYGAQIKPKDIVVADEQGAIVVPSEMLADIAEACEETKRRVRIVAEYCKSPNFNPPGLLDATKKMHPATPWKPSGKGPQK